MPDETPPDLTTVKNNFYHSKLKILDKMFAGELEYLQSGVHLDAIVMTQDTDEADKYTVDIYEKGYGQAPTKVAIDAYATSPYDSYFINGPAKVVYNHGVAYLVPTPQLFYLLVSYDGGSESTPKTYDMDHDVPSDGQPEGAENAASPKKNTVYGWPCDPNDLTVWSGQKKLSKKIRVAIEFPEVDPASTSYNNNTGTYYYLCLRIPTGVCKYNTDIVGLILSGGTAPEPVGFGILAADWVPGANLVTLKPCRSAADNTLLLDGTGHPLPQVGCTIVLPVGSYVSCLQNNKAGDGPYMYETKGGVRMLVNPNLIPAILNEYDTLVARGGQLVVDYPEGH